MIFLERTSAIDVEVNSTKKKKSNEKTSDVPECNTETSPTTSMQESNHQSLRTLEDTIASSIETKFEELKKIITKVYVLQKRSTDMNQVGSI